MINTQYINLNMTPSGVLPVLYCSQYDVGRPLGMVVYNGGEAVDLSAYTCTIEATRTDGTAITAAVTTDGSMGVFTTTATMTNVTDKYPAKLVIVDGSGNRVASIAFIMCVTPATMDENAESIEEDESLYQQYIGTVQTLISTERQQRLSADNTLQANIEAESTARANAVSAEASARQNADTALQSAISAEAATRAAADNTLQSQIDQLVAPSGEAPSAAEVQNIRIGADGTVYPSAGDAVRGQISRVTNTIGYIECPNLMGADLRQLYPVYIKSGEKITVSTSDGAAFDGTNRIYLYGANRSVVDWFGLYSTDGAKRTITVNQDIYFLSWYVSASTGARYMVNRGETALTYVEYYNDPTRFDYKGRASNPLSDSITQGYYSDVNATGTTSDLPENYGGFQNGLLEVFTIGTTTAITVQRLISGNGDVWVRFINVQTNAVGQWVQYAKQLALDSLISGVDTALNRLKNANLSLSGNYFDSVSAEWLDGFVTSSGTIDTSQGYHHAFAPLQGAGQYVRVMRYANFGSNTLSIQLYDINKQYITSKAGTRIDTTNCVSFTLSEDETRTAAYTVISIKDDYPWVAGLFYESDNYSYIGLRTPNANFGPSTNRLYKKMLVCDGDSICAAGLDKPYEGSGWYGRLKNDFSMTGKNYGVGGGSITADLYFASGDPRHWVCTSIDTIRTEYPTLDYLILEGGTNDADLIGSFTGDTPPAKFGTWSETDFSGSYDNSTYCGALDSLFYKAVTYYPTAKIGFIVAMEMGTVSSAIVNRKRYFDEAAKIAAKWHIPVLNLWEKVHADARLTAYYDSTLDASGNVAAKKFYNDGQHPTSYGYDLMQPMIESWISSL